MSNFSVNFTNPWLLFLLIPALALALLPYFRMAKQYRRNRNRVVSVVLHCIILAIAVLLVAGISFGYDIPNKENEIILLVDSSFSNRFSDEQRDDFIESVVNDSGNDYKIGIVKFGFDQKYVAPLTNDTRSAFRQYLNSDEPDTSATDIAAALRYASGLFENPTAGKIVLLSDGVETDGEAQSVIKGIASAGTRVDVAYFPTEEYPEVEVVGVETPDRNVLVDEQFDLKVSVVNNISGTFKHVTVDVTDNGEAAASLTFNLGDGRQQLTIPMSFSTAEMHQLAITVTNADDKVSQNNKYITYMYLNVFDKVLLIENREGESSDLLAALNEQYEVTDISVQSDLALFPQTLRELCEYDQVMFVNIANSDLPTGFDSLLYTYVHDLGGGLFTVGGENETDDEGNLIPHAYNRDDLVGSLYQEMLPVQAIKDYTPPVAVVIVVDCSGSMGTGESSPLAQAKRGALTCLDALSYRDYCGVVAFDSEASEELELTPVSQREKIREKIVNLPDNGEGSTIFSDAIGNAGNSFAGINVDKKHIILVTDGMPGDTPEDFNEKIDINLENDITMSIITVGAAGTSYDQMMDEAAERGGGKHVDTGDEGSGSLAEEIYKDLLSNAISEINYGREFPLRIAKHDAVTAGVEQEALNALPFTGYYGTREKEGVDVYVMGEYVPMYASWKVGEGKVASFMSSLNGEWSGNFLNDPTGQKLLFNMVNNVFPTEKVRVPDINITMREDNYTTALNVYTERDEGDTVKVTVTPISDEAVDYYTDTPLQVSESDGNTRFTFVITCPGIYQITAVKVGADGTEKASTTMYKTFSYSLEYDAFPDEETTGEEFLKSLAENGNGMLVTDSLDIFTTFDKSIHQTYDPRIALLITAIVLFLLDIAVRKFKFKWPHEIYRDHKAKKQLTNPDKD